MFVWFEFIQQNLKGLGKIDRKENVSFVGQWSQKEVMTHLSMGMGYQRENLTWPQDPLVWNEMDINDLEREA